MFSPSHFSSSAVTFLSIHFNGQCAEQMKKKQSSEDPLVQNNLTSASTTMKCA